MLRDFLLRYDSVQHGENNLLVRNVQKACKINTYYLLLTLLVRVPWRIEREMCRGFLGLQNHAVENPQGRTAYYFRAAILTLVWPNIPQAVCC